MCIVRTGLTLVRLQDEATFSECRQHKHKPPQEGCLSIGSLQTPRFFWNPMAISFISESHLNCLHLQHKSRFFSLDLWSPELEAIFFFLLSLIPLSPDLRNYLCDDTKVKIFINPASGSCLTTRLAHKNSECLLGTKPCPHASHIRSHSKFTLGLPPGPLPSLIHGLAAVASIPMTGSLLGSSCQRLCVHGLPEMGRDTHYVLMKKCSWQDAWLSFF